ncbi:MAG: AbrB/MazE/SpoVT family DNA-binding domain-containing protein [Euryarchaeota archaeon]|nr:AbrB/MazE/SpoVT family DNA-binding domain-containing protein [Euryarchaeota archaeon]
MSETYETVISARGQVVIGKPIRERLGLRPFQPVVERVEGGRIVLEPKRSAWDIPPMKGRKRARITSTNLEDVLYGAPR